MMLSISPGNLYLIYYLSGVLSICGVFWGPFLERPGNFTGPKSNIQIEIKNNKSAGPG